MTAEANLLSRRLEALSEDSRTDTRSMKILTFMASGLLPANLIAVRLIDELSFEVPRILTGLFSGYLLFRLDPAAKVDWAQDCSRPGGNVAICPLEFPLDGGDGGGRIHLDSSHALKTDCQSRCKTPGLNNRASMRFLYLEHGSAAGWVVWSRKSTHVWREQLQRLGLIHAAGMEERTHDRYANRPDSYRWDSLMVFVESGGGESCEAARWFIIVSWV